jgi:hypothetical protein
MTRATGWAAVLPAPVLAQADRADGSFFLLCCYGLILLGYLGLIVWVYNDARARGNDKAGLWALLVFFTPIIGWLIYLAAGRDQGTVYTPDPPPGPRPPPGSAPPFHWRDSDEETRRL